MPAAHMRSFWRSTLGTDFLILACASGINKELLHDSNVTEHNQILPPYSEGSPYTGADSTTPWQGVKS